MIYFKLPHSSTFYTTASDGTESKIMAVSFDGKESIEFPGSIKEFSSQEIESRGISTSNLSHSLQNFQEEEQNDYLQKIEDVISFVKENQLPKLVIARQKKISFHLEEVSLSQTFLNLCESYPNAFVYFFIQDDLCWIGAFSEVLGKFDKRTSEFETMSLAGTLPVHESWSKKELEEQQPVTDFISTVLSHFAQDFTQSETYDHPSGNIKHLRTDFNLSIQPYQLPDLIAALHPTPAVCGIPKKFCRDAIAKFENSSRSFYAGYIKVETANHIYYFVNLRCAQFFRNAALLYVGGGITADSLPEKEWRETELKAQAILRNMAFI